MNMTTPPLSPHEAFYNGAYVAFLDGLGCSGRMISMNREEALGAVEVILQDLLLESGCNATLENAAETFSANDDDKFGIYPFFIKKGS